MSKNSMFLPTNWYWFDEKNQRLYGSQRQSIFSVEESYTDGPFQTWRARGLVPTPWPLNEIGEPTEEVLKVTLELLGLKMFPYTLEELKEKKLLELDTVASKIIISGFPFEVNGVTYKFSYDADDQQNFSDGNSEALFYLGSPEMAETLLGPYSREWRGWTLTPNSLPVVFIFSHPAHFLSLSASGANHKSSTLATGWALQEQVRQATSEEELEAIVWPIPVYA